jgi:phytoene desaturase
MGTQQRKAIVIGAGIAGIGTAVRLANLGFRVTVFEANAYPGGKLSEFELDGYRFDAGPSLFTMPHFVTELFELSGEHPDAYFQYTKLPVICKYFYEDGLEMEAFADEKAFIAEISAKTGEPAANLEKFLAKSRELYQITEHVFLKKSLHRLDTYLNRDTLRSLLQLHKLDVFKSMYKANQETFSDPRLVQFFNRYATYNGSNPYKAPATLNIIPYLETGIGAFFPKGGMFSITNSLFELARRLGVEFVFGKKVTEILVGNQQLATSIVVEGEKIPADLVVSNMDIVYTYRLLLKSQPQPEKLLKQPKSSSALIFYWGITQAFPQLDLHNILFSADYQNEFDYIFNKKSICHDPTVYVNISSKYHAADAPEGHENWFTMINVPNNQGQDWDTLIGKAREDILTKVSRLLGTDIAPLIATETILDPRLIEQKTSSSAGALYGNSSNNPFAAFLRHPNFSRKIKNLYFCGGSVHPGGGVPLCLLSAKIVGDLVAQDFNVTYRSMVKA